jgi:23S rRNA (adenine2503-C2)-methyltransferase
MFRLKASKRASTGILRRSSVKYEIEMTEKTHLTGLSQSELVEFVEQMGEQKFRGRQIFANLQNRRTLDFAEMTDLPKNLRAKLEETSELKKLRVESRYVSADGTRRFLFKTHDNLPVEAVFIPTDNRDTICFSSQSGCPLKCDFCLTAKLGLLRNLTAGEIVEQIITVLNDVYGAGNETPHGTNLVAMGAGEPFLNFENLLKALRVMADEKGLFIVPNRVTVSTAGIVPKIYELAQTEMRPHLAISLSAPNDELRDKLMPINKRWNIEELMTACKEFEKSLKPNERFTFEYVMLGEVNDTDDHARQLANLINRHGFKHVKINLIPHNSAEPLEYRPSAWEQIERFQDILNSKGVDSYVRRPRGRDIYAACGQLAAKTAPNLVQITV